MKLTEVKQGLIQKFFKQVEDGIAFERCGGIYVRLRQLLNSPRATSILEGLKFNEHDNPVKAFREFDSSPVAALEAVSPEDKMYFLAGKSGRKSYACVEITNEDAEPRGCTAVSIKQSLLEIRDEFGDDVRYRVRTPSSVLKEVIYISDRRPGFSSKIKNAVTKVYNVFTNAGFDVKEAGSVTPYTLARYSFANPSEIGHHRLILEVRTEPGAVKRIRLSDIEIDRNRRNSELSEPGVSLGYQTHRAQGPLYTLYMDLEPESSVRPGANMHLELKGMTEDELVKELRSAWTKFRPYYEKLKKIS